MSTPGFNRKSVRAIQCRDEIDAIRARHLAIYNQYVSDMKPCGKRWKARCPLHDDHTPSFFVFDDGGCKCFGCGFAGDVFDFLMQYERVRFQEAKRKAAEIAGITLDHVRPAAQAERRDWAARRRQAEQKAGDLTAWRTAKLLELRRQRNRLYRSELIVSAAARVLLANPTGEDEAAWRVIWSHALDNVGGEVLQTQIDRLDSMSPHELAAYKARMETRPA